ncbi:hypothetical protein BDR22DRAFT_968030 [Usnea florida]
MKVFTPCKLTHTLQTYLGMVVGDGKPQQRSYPSMPKYLTDKESGEELTRSPNSFSEKDLLSLFTSCVLECRLPQVQNTQHGPGMNRLRSNIYSCCDTRLDIAFMKKNIDLLQRLDLEQAAAVVISAIGNDHGIANRSEIVQSLLQEIEPKVLRDSCMWTEDSDLNTAKVIQTLKFSRMVKQVRHILQDKYAIQLGKIHDWTALIPFLLRIRRCSPRSRCLFVPEWIFREANTTPPPEFHIWDNQGRVAGGHEPTLVATSDSIVLTRREYRRLQRRLLRYYLFWDPTVRLRHDIRDLEANTIYSASLIKSHVLPSTNTLIVAHYFFALQRRLQRKVVSDLQWTSFLRKGESSTIMQNNPDIPTTFEQRLAAFSHQSGVPLSGPIQPQIDKCCLLMETYVQIYGAGDRTTLVFKRGVSGGSGRGAVDEYNLLCDILKTLCGKAKEEGLKMPGPVRKFLAKDIMASNQAFDDDAFAGGRVPGWETWLAERRAKGNIGGVERMHIV